MKKKKKIVKYYNSFLAHHKESKKQKKNEITCNCRIKASCLMEGKCLSESVFLKLLLYNKKDDIVLNLPQETSKKKDLTNICIALDIKI